MLFLPRRCTKPGSPARHLRTNYHISLPRVRHNDRVGNGSADKSTKGVAMQNYVTLTDRGWYYFNWKTLQYVGPFEFRTIAILEAMKGGN